MNLSRKSSEPTNPYSLTDDEKSALRSSRMPPEVKALLPRNLDVMATDTLAAQKATAYLMAQAQMLRTAREIQLMIDESEEVAELKRIASVARQEAQALEVDNRRMTNQIARAKAMPALAVHADD